MPHSTKAAAMGPIPPHAQFRGFLPAEDCSALTVWAIAQESSFKPAKIFYGPEQRRGIDPAIRAALKHSGVGPMAPMLSRRLLAALPEVMAAAGYRGPEPRSLEFEVTAYGDGAHFAPHIDIPLGPDRRPVGNKVGEDRLITAIYYFHGEPKGFSGGKLRLYRFGADDSQSEDSIGFDPLHNSLLVFPSWARHGVEKVHCPTGRFADFRFAINCWFCRSVVD